MPESQSVSKGEAEEVLHVLHLSNMKKHFQTGNGPSYESSLPVFISGIVTALHFVEYM